MSLKKKRKPNKQNPLEGYEKIAKLAFHIMKDAKEYKGNDHRLMEDMINVLLKFYRETNPRGYQMLRFLVMEKLDEQWDLDLSGTKPN